MSDDDGGFFASFARSMVQRSLPAAREWMRKRLGPAADVGHVEVRGPKLVVTGAKIPLGARLLFEVDHATLDIDPDAVVSGGMPVRFRRATGTLTAAGLLAIPVSLVGRGGAWLDADLTATDAKWDASETLLSGRGRVVVGPDHWRLDDLRLGGEGESIEASASGAPGRLPTTRLSFDGAHAGRLLDTWQAIAGRPWNLPIPRAARVDGTVSFAAVGSRADLRLKTQQSDLAVELSAQPNGELETFALTGQLGLDELPGVPWVSGGEPLKVRARLGGRMDALRGSVQLASPSVRSPWLNDAVPFELAASLNDDDAALHVNLGPAGEGRVAATFDPDGRAEGEGTATLDPKAVRAMGIALDSPPLAFTLRVGGSRTSPLLHADTTTKQLVASAASHALTLQTLKFSLGWVGGFDARLRARLGTGSLHLEHQGASSRVRAERIRRDDALAAAALFGVAVPALPVPDSAQLWADLTLGSGTVDGEIHAESTRSRLTIAPLCSRKATGFDGTRLRGAVDLADVPWLPGSDGRVTLEGTVRGPRVAPYLDLSLRADELGLALLPDAPLQVAALEASLTARRNGVLLSALSARVFGGVLSASGARVERQPDGLRVMAGELTAVDLREGTGRWLRLFGVPVQTDPTLNLRCVDDGDGVRMQAHVRGEQTDLRADVAVSAGALDGTWEGHAGLDDFDLPVRGGRVTLRGGLDGALSRPRATLRAELVQGCELVLGTVTVPVAHAVAEARFSRERWVWSGMEAQLLGGRVRSRGVFGRDTGLLGEVQAEDLEVGRVQLAGEPLESRLSGSFEGTLRLAGRAAKGRFLLHEPRYGVLSEAAPVLSRWGLPVPPLSGRRPLRLTVELEDGGLRVSEFEASVPGLRVHGDAELDDRGGISGDVVLDAGPSWLRDGRSLARLGHWLGGITVPVRLAGDLARLRLLPDVRAALRITFERLFRDVPTSRPALPAHGPTSLLGTDALLDRVAAGGDDAEDALDALLERGMSPEEIAERVAKRRAR
ncbi:MAG: hypothetical protein AB8I08_01455 [Sandaracinaceae bacterium]